MQNTSWMVRISGRPLSPRQQGYLDVVQPADDGQQAVGVEPLVAVQRLRRDHRRQPYPLRSGTLQRPDEHRDILPAQAQQVEGRSDDDVPAVGPGHLEQGVVQQLDDLLPSTEEGGLVVVVGLKGDVAAVPVIGGLQGVEQLLLPALVPSLLAHQKAGYLPDDGLRVPR